MVTDDDSDIFSSQGLNGEGLVLMCKNTGRWTNKLYDLAQSVQRGEAGGFGQEIKVLVEGPYGWCDFIMFCSC